VVAEGASEVGLHSPVSASSWAPPSAWRSSTFSSPSLVLPACC
jgi:hypothetical protein